MPTLERPPVLLKNCGNCSHYDLDHYCALPLEFRKLAGRIIIAEAVVCSEHDEQDYIAIARGGRDLIVPPTDRGGK